MRTAQGSEAQLTARYIAGCDGARSLVREAIGAGFPGGTYRQVFYVADIEGAGPPVNGELHVDLDEADFLAVFPLAGTGRVRLVGSVRDERAEHADTLGFEDVSGRAIAHLGSKSQGQLVLDLSRAPSRRRAASCAGAPSFSAMPRTSTAPSAARG